MIPNGVWVGPIWFDLQFVEDLETDKGEPLDGHIVYGDAIIKVKANMADSVRKQVFLHEIVHAMCSQNGVKLSEKDTDRLAYTLLDLFQTNENQPVIRWLAE